MNRAEKIASLIKDKENIIKIKKLAYKLTDGFEFQTSKVLSVTKADSTNDTDEIIKRSIIANTYNYLDSHDDVHLDGVFSKTIKENNPFFLHDHKFEVGAQIGNILKSYEQKIAWKDLGINKEGETTSLVHDVEIIKAYNEGIFDKYRMGAINQHSVGMMYVKIDLAVDDRSDSKGFDLFNKVLPLLGNSEKALEQGYFFVVSEAKLRETSAVLMGSNPLTGIFSDSNKENLQENLIKAIKNIENKDIIYNIVKDINETYNLFEPLKDTKKDREPSFIELLAKDLSKKTI